MKYKINTIYLDVNKEMAPVGVILGEDGNPYSFTPTERITISEYEEGLMSFRYGGQITSTGFGYIYGTIVGNKIQGYIDQKWLDELKKLGYHIELLECDDRL